MARLIFAAGVLCAAAAFAGRADSQSPSMPGQVVSNEVIRPVGKQIPKPEPSVGQPINMPLNNPNMRPYNPTRPLDVFKGTNLSASQVVAPVRGIDGQSTLHTLYDNLKSIVGLSKPTFTGPPSGWFPSLSRRNRERAEARLWRID